MHDHDCDYPHTQSGNVGEDRHLEQDPVCGMDVDPKTDPKSVYKGKTYYFCSDDDKKTFDSAPDKFANATLRR